MTCVCVGRAGGGEGGGKRDLLLIYGWQKR